MKNDIEIVFCKHVFERYVERELDPNLVRKNGFMKIDRLEKEVRNKGVIYLEKSIEGNTKYVINCNNLTVYRAHETGDAPDILFIDTVYPYKQSLRPWLNQLQRCEIKDNQIKLLV